MMRRRSTLTPLDEISDSFDCPLVDESTIPKILMGHKSSLESLLTDTEKHNESRVLVIYTGGTIGMMSNERGKLAPISGALETSIKIYPHIHDAPYAALRFSGIASPPLVLPFCRERNRVLYWVYEYNPLLDSCDMTMDDWVRVAVDIKREYEYFDGFVVLHGTDTLAYTASALSFMMENLGKPVIITGSQIPLFETRSDGRDNFIGSLIIAGNYSIPEVAVFFNNKLYRGNRTVKVSSGSLAAFNSPNMAPLAVAGVSIQVDSRLIFRSNKLAKFDVAESFNRHVGLLRIFPSISTDTVKTLLMPPIEGAVLQTYGAGNLPSNRKDIIALLKEATSRGVIIVNITQCLHGSVEAIYETGEILRDAGVLPGYDMTPEAALTKLSYITAMTDISLEQKRKLIMTNLRGELTSSLPEEENEPAHINVVAAISKALQLSFPSEVEQVKEILIPTLFSRAVSNCDLVRMGELWPHVSEINHINSSGCTPFHIAAREGDTEVVRWLLERGASVHLRDGNGNTPLWIAIQQDHLKVVTLLRQTGAHLKEPSLLQIGEAIIAAAGNNNVKRLRSLEAAGCDMNTPDIFKKTGLHAACLMGASEAVQFLLAVNVNTNAKDRNGLTAEECAEMNDFPFLSDVIKEHRRIREQLANSRKPVLKHSS